MMGAFFPIAVYVFVYSLLKRKIKKFNIVFVLSYAIALIPIYYFIQYLLLSNGEQALFFEELKRGAYPQSITLYNVIFYSFQQVVFASLLWMCYQYGKKDEVNHLINDRVYYLKVFLWAIFSSNTFLLIASLFFDVLLVEYLLLPISLIIIHSCTIYYGFKNPAILSKEEIDFKASQKQSNKGPSASKSNLSEDELNLLEEKILLSLSQDSIYKDSDISLSKMAELLEIPAYKVSKTINQKMQTNFHDLINSKRVDASLELLKVNKQFTIEAVALEVGFKSKSTFYRAFKKNKGITPSQYLSEK